MIARLFLFLLFILGTIQGYAQEAQKRPNIVLIFTDEMSAEYLGCYGGQYPTPNIDRLAREGMRFDRAFTSSAACTPSRYAVLTGHYAGRCQEPSFLQANPLDQPYTVSWNTHITAGTPTIPSILREVGYQSSMSGKNHVASRDPWWPQLEAMGPPPSEDLLDPAVDAWLQHHQEQLSLHIAEQLGFDQCLAVIRGNNEQCPLPALQHHNMAWTSWGAAKFMEERDPSQPFFLFTAPTGIHGPWHGEEHTKDPRYTPGGFNPAVKAHQLDPAIVAREMEGLSSGEQHHRQGLMQIDHHVGLILDQLEALGIADETLVVFTADHGVEPGKASTYVRGNRVPMIMRWPNRIPAGSVSDSLVAQVDLLSTFAALASAPIPEGHTFDGVDLQPLLADPTATPRTIIYTEMGYSRAVFDGRHQLIRVRFPESVLQALEKGERTLAPNHLGANTSHANFTAAWFPAYHDQDQLFDLETDPLMLRNLYHHEPQNTIRESLATELETLTSTFAHPFPQEPQAFLESPAWLQLVQAAKRHRMEQPDWEKRDHDRISWPPIR